VEEVDVVRELVAERTQPGEERRDAHTAGDPQLAVGAAGVAGAAEWPADDGSHAGLDELLHARGVVAERLDRHTKDPFAWALAM
jgi:hypothetical protein